MPLTKVGIVNSALAKLGVDRISSFTENVQAARLANDLYDLKRDEVLRAHNWDFARQRAELGALVDEASFGHLRKRFQLPSDCLKVLRMEDRRTEFSVEAGILFTNAASARIWYTRRETDTSLYEASFVDALATRLAVDFCIPLLQDRQYRQSLFEEYKFLLGVARTYDSQQGTPDLTLIETWTDARRGTGRPFGPGNLT